MDFHLSMRSSRQRKSPTLVLPPLLVVTLLALSVYISYERQIPSDPMLNIAAYLCALIWWIILLWALHHLTFQIASLFVPDDELKPSLIREIPAVALLYTTCDDFNPRCCQSCLCQDYPNVRILICDDSQSPIYRAQVDDFASRNVSNCSVIRRPTRRGFKAGNLNDTISVCVVEDWVLIVDADQILPSNYLSRLVACLPADNSNVSFLQAAHEATSFSENSPFQEIMSAGVALYYMRNLVLRDRYGFAPFLGHGALIRREAWETLGMFTETVSEDFVFAVNAANKGFNSIYVPDIVSYEAFPYDFGGFVLRFRKYAGGAAEIFHHYMLPFLRGPAYIIEKWDALLQIGWYILMPLVIINGFLTAYISHRLWQARISYLHPLLPYLYLWMLFLAFVIQISVSRTWHHKLQYYFWSAALYTAAMPLIAFSFVKHWFVTPQFISTPKNAARSPIQHAESSIMILFGIFTVILALLWISPFSPVLVSCGIAYTSYPLYGHLCNKSYVGSFARMVIYLPGLLIFVGVFAAWAYAYIYTGARS